MRKTPVVVGYTVQVTTGEWTPMAATLSVSKKVLDLMVT